VTHNGIEELERMRCACHVIIGYLHTVCSDGNSAETETRRRIAFRGTPSGGNYYRRIFPTRAICLPPLIILGDRDLPKIAPKWLVTSESNGINDCCAGIVDEIAQLCVQYQCVRYWTHSCQIYNSLTSHYYFHFPFLLVLQRFL